MKETTLHIGTTKTGSTSIQGFLARNRDILHRHKVLYPRSLGETSHNAIPVFLHGRLANRFLQKKYKIKTAADYALFEQIRVPSLEAEITKSDPDHIIISSEHMHSRCTRSAQFARLKTLLAPALDSRALRIVVYLRPQISHAISLYSTMLRHGLDQDIDSFLTERMTGSKRNYYDFQQLLQTWAAAFDAAEIEVRAFNKVVHLAQGVVADFMEISGLTPLSDRLTFPERANESMGAWTAEALRLLNNRKEQLPSAMVRETRRWLRHDLKGGRVQPDPVLARRFQDSFATGNRWVIDTYFPQDTGALDVDWDAFDNPPPEPEITPQRLIALLTRLGLSFPHK